eukprot:scaffold47602_cov17-Tisochrysis_lutea.AAC.1
MAKQGVYLHVYIASEPRASRKYAAHLRGSRDRSQSNLIVPLLLIPQGLCLRPKFEPKLPPRQLTAYASILDPAQAQRLLQ